MHDYTLALNLFSMSAAFESYAGRLKESNEMVDVVLSRAKTTECKMSVYHVRLENLGAEGRVVAALEFGLRVLDELGEKLPRKPTKAGMMKEFVSVGLSRRRRDDDFLSIGKMNNSSKLAAMEILRLMTHFAFGLSEDWFPLLTLHSMAMTLRWGLSPCSPSAVAAYAVLLAGRKEQHESSRFGKIALTLLETLNSKEDEAYTLLLLGRLFTHQNDPISDQSGIFNRALITASSLSQFHVAASAACCELDASFVGGMPLGYLSKKVSSLRHQDNQVNKLTKTLVLPLFELISSLRHPQYKCVLLSGGKQEPNPIARQSLPGIEQLECSLYFYQIAQAAFFQDWERTIKIYETFQTEQRRFLKTAKTNVLFLPMMLHVGVAYFATVSSHPSRLKNGKLILREVKGIADISPRLSFARLCYNMLDAEHTGLMDRSEVYRAFDELMATCRDYDYLHYEAFAAERAGMLLLEMNLVPAAKQYLGRGRSLYKDWGALGKVHAIEGLLQSLGKRSVV
jgi:predicted ATPase